MSLMCTQNISYLPLTFTKKKAKNLRQAFFYEIFAAIDSSWLRGARGINFCTGVFHPFG